MTQTSKRVQQEATHWAVKSQLGPLSAQEQASLTHWLDADPRHRGAFIRANVVRASVERVAALAGGAVPASRKRSALFTRLQPLVNPRALAVAASVLILVAVAGWMAHPAGERYVSDIGELRQVALGDGSSMFLNTSTEAVVKLSAAAREVKLAEGEALFEVARDPTRPFRVRAGGVTVEAIGTAFSVRNVDGRVDVTVSEGVIELTQPGSAPKRLTADHHARIADARPVTIEAMSRHETDRQLSWRTGRLEFDGQTLGEAVAEMNRHNRRQIAVSDALLASEPVVGVFRSVDADAFARIAAAALDAHVVEEGRVLRIEPSAAR